MRSGAVSQYELGVIRLPGGPRPFRCSISLALYSRNSSVAIAIGKVTPKNPGTKLSAILFLCKALEPDG